MYLNQHYKNWTISSHQLWFLAFAVLTAYLTIYTPEAGAFVKQLPKEVQDVKSVGILGTILNLVIGAVAIAAGIGLIGIPIMTVKNAMQVLGDIGDGRATYGKLFGVVVAGVLVELICIALIYFAWDYLIAAKEIIG